MSIKQHVYKIPRASSGGCAVKLELISCVSNSVPDAFTCPTRQMMLDSVSMETTVNSASLVVDSAATTRMRSVKRMMSVKYTCSNYNTPACHMSLPLCLSVCVLVCVHSEDSTAGATPYF